MIAFGAFLTSWIHFVTHYRHTVDRFWFFAARHNPDDAPLVTWFNGGVSIIDDFIDLQYLLATDLISPEVPAWSDCSRNLALVVLITRALESI
jgi:hypothetical protein